MPHKLNVLLVERKEIEEEKATYDSPVGWWKVTTEGDCEGKSVRDLGMFYGHLAEIAFHLAPKCCYSLTFDPKNKPLPAVRPVYDVVKEVQEVFVVLNIDSGTWHMSREDRVDYMSNFLDCNEVEVCDGNYYASTKLVRKF
jgi:hypothetical protein